MKITFFDAAHHVRKAPHTAAAAFAWKHDKLVIVPTTEKLERWMLFTDTSGKNLFMNPASMDSKAARTYLSENEIQAAHAYLEEFVSTHGSYTSAICDEMLPREGDFFLHEKSLQQVSYKPQASARHNDIT